MTFPADPRFPEGTRVRIVALPDAIANVTHIIGYTGTVCRAGATQGPRNLTVCFDPDPEKPDSTGFWTFAAEHLELVDGQDANQTTPSPTPQLALDMP